MRTFVLLAFVLLFSMSAAAQELPDSPKPSRRVFLVGVSALAASKAADVWTTRGVLARGGSESNPIFGPNPSVRRQVSMNAALFAGQVGIFYFTEKSQHRWIRWTGRAVMAFSIEEHTRMAIRNHGIRR